MNAHWMESGDVWWAGRGLRRKKTTSNNVGALIHTSAPLYYTKVLSLLSIVF